MKGYPTLIKSTSILPFVEEVAYFRLRCIDIYRYLHQCSRVNASRIVNVSIYIRTLPLTTSLFAPRKTTKDFNFAPYPLAAKHTETSIFSWPVDFNEIVVFPFLPTVVYAIISFQTAGLVHANYMRGIVVKCFQQTPYMQNI